MEPRGKVRFSPHVLRTIHTFITPVPPTSNNAQPSLILIMGVAGSGKTTVGHQLARQLDWEYEEADNYHSLDNKEKMRRGIPLSDADREPWILAIRAAIDTRFATGRAAVFTCSALKSRYRHTLLNDLKGVALVHLTGDPNLLLSRLQNRPGHFMKADMLESQLAILEPPTNALTLDVANSPEMLVSAIRRHCGV